MDKERSNTRFTKVDYIGFAIYMILVIMVALLIIGPKPYWG